MSNKLSNIELIVLLKNYSKASNLKIPKLQQKNKQELLYLCKFYKLLNTTNDNNNVNDNDNVNIPIKYITETLTKKQMINDIEIYYIKQNKKIDNLHKMKKDELIIIIDDNNIPHITQLDIKNEIEEFNKYNEYLIIIKYNYIKYDKFLLNSIDFDNLNSKDLLSFIETNKLDTNCNEDLFNITNKFLGDVITSYKTYCKNMNIPCFIERGTIPYILHNLNKLLLNNN